MAQLEAFSSQFLVLITIAKFLFEKNFLIRNKSAKSSLKSKT